MRRVIIALLFLFVLVSPASAMLVTADADGFADGANISNAFGGMALSSVGGYTGLDGVVYAWGDGLASTGASVFANNLSFQRQWYAEPLEGFALRADFDQPANYVAIDIIGDDSGDFGVLEAYDSLGTLLDSVVSPQLSVGQIWTAQINRTSFDIAYIIAGGSAATEDTVHLDNLSANVVPEPVTIWLLGMGSLLLTTRRRRSY